MTKSILILLFALVVWGCAGKPAENAEVPAAPAASSSEEILKRGKYLVTVAGCNDCHTPKVMTDHGPQLDTTRILSGHPMNEQLPPFVKADGWLMFGMGLTSYVGPWGVSFSANLTPHETGLGNWTLDQFKIAFRQGKSKGIVNNRTLLPPMPWEMFQHITDEDVNAIFTYLQSIPPVNNAVPAPIPPDKIFTVASQK
jgi:hypothetical protein